MSYHEWGDEWFLQYGLDLDRAMILIDEETRKWSRCILICKEKYGTIRYEYVLPPLPNSWTHTKLKSFIYYTWVKIGKMALKRAIRKACKKYPHIEKEILEDAQWI